MYVHIYLQRFFWKNSSDCAIASKMASVYVKLQRLSEHGVFLRLRIVSQNMVGLGGMLDY